MCGDTDTKSTNYTQANIDRQTALSYPSSPRGGDKNIRTDKDNEASAAQVISEVISHASAISSSLDGFGGLSINVCSDSSGS